MTHPGSANALRKALEWYANESSYHPNGTPMTPFVNGKPDPDNPLKDFGRIARAALSADAALSQQNRVLTVDELLAGLREDATDTRPDCSSFPITVKPAAPQAQASWDWVPLAKALFDLERNPAIKDQAWFDFQSKAELIIRAMASHSAGGEKK